MIHLIAKETIRCFSRTLNLYFKNARLPVAVIIKQIEIAFITATLHTVRYWCLIEKSGALTYLYLHFNYDKVPCVAVGDWVLELLA